MSDEGRIVERALIGAMLQRASVIQDVRSRLDIGDFGLDPHRLIVRAIFELHNQGIDPDIITVHAHLSMAGELEQAGGAAFVSGLIDGVPITNDVTHYCRMIKTVANEHRIASEFELARLAIEDGESPADVLAGRLPKLTELHTGRTVGDGSADVEIGCTGADLKAAQPSNIQWIVSSYIGLGLVIELIGLMKGGKSRWAMALVRVCLFGGDFIGRYVQPCPVLYLTEQSPQSFAEQAREAGILDSQNLHIIFFHETTLYSWEQVVSLVVKKAKKVGARLIIIDTFSKFARFKDEGENDSAEGQRKMNPLCEAAAVENLAVLSLRHARKSGGDVNVAGRGSGVLTGAADICLCLQKSTQGNFMRELTAVGRFPETPDKCVIELSGTHYQLLDDTGSIKRERNQNALLAILPREPDPPIKLEQILKASKVGKGNCSPNPP